MMIWMIWTLTTAAQRVSTITELPRHRRRVLITAALAQSVMMIKAVMTMAVVTTMVLMIKERHRLKA